MHAIMTVGPTYRRTHFLLPPGTTTEDIERLFVGMREVDYSSDGSLRITGMDPVQFHLVSDMDVSKAEDRWEEVLEQMDKMEKEGSEEKL